MSMDSDDSSNELKTIVIFGISSFVGSNLAEFFKKDYRVIGTYYRNPVQIKGVMTIPCDVLAKEDVQLALFAFKPDIAIYCVGLSSVNECHQKPDLADALNTSGLINVTEYCQRYRTKICYISSGFIFAGEKKNYFEMDIPDASTTYGKSLSAAEFYVQKTSLNYLIFRCCRLYGRGISKDKKTWFELLQQYMSNNRQVSLESNIHTGYLDIYYLAMLIKIVFDKGATNRLFQITSRDILTMYDFGRLYADQFKATKELIIRKRTDFPLLLGPGSSVSADSELYFKMDTNNIEGYLNIELPTISESVELTHKRFNGRKENDKGSRQADDIQFI
jgi:dTDP-4-dehydrorhamnose reductase